MDRHSRQLVLNDVGVTGQRRLRDARVVVVGCGGLGAPVVQQLAAAGVGHLTLIDDDVVEASNLNRQTLFAPADLGRRKADVAAAWVARFDGALDVVAVTDRVHAGSARDVVRGADVVVDCSDGLPTKFLLNDACVAEDVALVHGAATAWSGQVVVVDGRRGPCLRCLFPVLPSRDAVPTCRVAGIVAPVTGVVGSLQAAEVLKCLLKMPGTLVGRFVAVDVKEGTTRAVRFDKDPACPSCGAGPDGRGPIHDGRRASDYVMPDCEDDR